MDNVLNNIGDILTIGIEPKMSGRIRITGFVEAIDGETENRTCKREFRISTNNFFWSEWAELTVENISAKEYLIDSSFSIQLRYTRTGTDTTGTIVFRSIDFSGTRTEINFIAPTLASSILGSGVGSDALRALELNLFKKLYYRGIVADYVERGANNDYQEDKDYADLFFTIARFYALFMVFFQRWENFGEDFDLLREQVRGYGLYFNEGTVTLEELKYLAQNIFSQAQQRGTRMIFNRKGEEGVPVDGEFVRLTRNQEGDELLSENIPLWKSGWCLGKSSPLYRGTARAHNLNKTKENTEDFQRLEDFTITASGDAAYSLATADDGKGVLKIELTKSNDGVTLGRWSSEFVPDTLYCVDPQIDYEITFAFRLVTASQRATLNLRVYGYDINREEVADAFIAPFLLGGVEITSWKTGVWYFVRGIVYAYSSQISRGQKTTNLGWGQNNAFNNLSVRYILPSISFYQFSKGDTTTIELWDYKIRPLVRGKNILPLRNGTENSFSLGFVQSGQLFHTYFRNNNNSQSQEEVTDIIERYLYPFNTTNLFTVTGNNN